MSLIEETLFGRIDKVAIAIERLKTFEPPEGYYLAFSGGKDSVVIYDLAKKAEVKFEAHMNITGIDPPELLWFVRKWYPEIKRHLPQKTMWKLIREKLMPPTRVVRYCCDKLKETGGSGRRVVTGIRWAESLRRSNRKIIEHCYKDKRKVYINPIIDWKDEDVWEYIRTYNIKYCHLYDEGYKRIGCLMCPLMGTWKMLEDANRYPKYKAAYLRAFDKMIVNRRAKGMNVEWKNGEEVWLWWINKKDEYNPDQTVMFE